MQRSFDQYLNTGARLVVNLDEIPKTEQGCYDLYGVFLYLIFYPGGFRYSGFTEAKKDHLTVFSPGLVEKYRGTSLDAEPKTPLVDLRLRPAAAVNCVNHEGRQKSGEATGTDRNPH
jgi:hypothetical protein